MVFFKKKEKKVETYDNGKKKEEAVAELKVPQPQEPQKAEEPPLLAQDVYEEGRRVGFQEGMIYSLNTLNDAFKSVQEEIRQKIQQEEKPEVILKAGNPAR